MTTIPRGAFRRQLIGWLKYHNLSHQAASIDDYGARGLVFSFSKCKLAAHVHQELCEEGMGFKVRAEYEAFFDFAYKHGYRFEFLSWNVIEFEPVRTDAEIVALHQYDAQLPF